MELGRLVTESIAVGIQKEKEKVHSNKAMRGNDADGLRVRDMPAQSYLLPLVRQEDSGTCQWKHAHSAGKSTAELE